MELSHTLKEIWDVGSCHIAFCSGESWLICNNITCFKDMVLLAFSGDFNKYNNM